MVFIHHILVHRNMLRIEKIKILRKTKKKHPSEGLQNIFFQVYQKFNIHEMFKTFLTKRIYIYILQTCFIYHFIFTDILKPIFRF